MSDNKEQNDIDVKSNNSEEKVSQKKFALVKAQIAKLM